jgi:hypothetical protein
VRVELVAFLTGVEDRVDSRPVRGGVPAEREPVTVDDQRHDGSPPELSVITEKGDDGTVTTVCVFATVMTLDSPGAAMTSGDVMARR